MFTDKDMIIFLFLLIPLILGGGVFFLTTIAANKIHKLPKSPDEFEKLIILESHRNMTGYWIFSLILLNFLVSDRWMISRLNLSALIVGLFFVGIFLQRILMKRISRKYVGNQ